VTDYNRISRLADLARKVWPDARAEVSLHRDMLDIGGHSDQGSYKLLTRVVHPRALEAVEAALYLLAMPENGLQGSVNFLAICQANAELGAAVIDRDITLRRIKEAVAAAKREDALMEPEIVLALLEEKP